MEPKEVYDIVLEKAIEAGCDRKTAAKIAKGVETEYKKRTDDDFDPPMVTSRPPQGRDLL